MAAVADQAIKELAPTGKLRVGVAVGPAASALWCVRDPATGKARGVPVDVLPGRNAAMAVRHCV